jgi:hypothetical protein
MDVVLDQGRDKTGQELHRITNLYSPPEFVKHADYSNVCGDPQTLPLHIYADPRTRRYPCHTKAATWMSSAFFADKRSCYQPTDADMVETRLIKAAKYHGIEPIVREVFKKAVAYNNHDKSVLPDDMFAFVWEKDDGTTERHLPLRNRFEVKAAADYLQCNRDEFTYEDRRTMAQKVLSKAAEHSVDLDEHLEFLEKQAGNGACAGKAAVRLLENRAALIPNKDLKDQLKQAASIFKNSPTTAHNSNHMQKLASLVDGIDREFNLIADYGVSVPRPEDVLFNVNEKSASSAIIAHIPMTNGNIYKIADLENLAINEIRDWMGTDFADEVSAGGLFVSTEKLAELLPTLPRGDADHFDRLLSKKGIEPFAKEAASESLGLSRSDLFSLAASYDG